MNANKTGFPLMTVEEFDALPEPKDNFTYELHFGSLVKVVRATKGRYLLQCSTRDVLSQQLDPKKWFTSIELAYNLVEGYDGRVADAAVVSHARYDQVARRWLPDGLTGTGGVRQVPIESRCTDREGRDRMLDTRSRSGL